MRLQLHHGASQATFERLTRVVPGGVNSPFRGFQAVGGTPPVMVRGEGAYVWDEDGNRYLDLLGAWGPLLLGHAAPVLKAAAHAAVDDGSVFGASTPWELELAEKLQAIFPSMDMVRCVNSGTEAVMSAVRLARGYTGRTRIVRFEGGYHGHVDCLLEAVGTEAPAGLTLAAAGIPPAVAADTVSLTYNDVAGLEAYFAAHGADTAAVILEPVTGSMGVIEARADFLAALRRLTTAHGAVLIFDEVITGLRVSRGGAQERLGVAPDLTVLGKALSGGFAIGAFGGRRDIMMHLSPLGAVYQAGTYSGNPISMRCASATIDELGRPGTYERLEALGRRLADGWQDAARQAGVPMWVPQVGSMLGVMFIDAAPVNYRQAMRADVDRFARFFHGMLSRGVVLPTSTHDAVCVSTAHTEADVDLGVTCAREALADL